MKRILSRRNGRAERGHGQGLVGARASGDAVTDRRRCRPGVLELEGRRLLSTFYVTSTADDNSAGTLREVIAAASQVGATNTIAFKLANPGTPQTITLSQGVLVLGGGANLTIQGPGAGLLTIDAAKSSRVFQVSLDETARISGLTITGGTGTSGGGVYSSGNTTLSNCVVTGNTATTYGGGVFGSNSLDLTDCTITANSSFMGGGVYASVKVATAPTITDCTISGNSAGQNGAGAYLGGTASVTDCTISGNSAAKYGGGLWTDGTSTLTGCTISGNSAGKYGGGLCVYQGSPTLDACTISGNSSGTYGGGLFNFRKVPSSLTDCTITGNTSGHGGGLFNYGGTPTLMSCTIADNLATTGFGGLDNYYGTTYKGKVSLTNTIVAGNNQGTSTPTASDIGGSGASGVTGTYNLIGTGGSGGITGGTGGDVVLSSLSTLGLAPLADYGGPTPTMALLPGSAAIGAGTSTGAPTTDQRGFALDSPIDIGAFQYASGSSLVVTSATDGAATPSGDLDLRGALDLAGLQSGSMGISFSSSAFASASTITLSAGPLVASSGSATISIAGPSAGLTISGGTGGVISVGSGANLSISDLTISGGSATLGGGVDNDGTLTLTGCTISGDSAATGGGLYNKGTMTLVECTVAANSAGQGGGIANAGTLTLTASTISGNSAGTGGGGLYESSAATGATANDTIVAGNLGTAGAASDIAGAGAANVNGSSSLIGTGGSGGITNGTGNDIVLSSLTTLGLSALGSYGGTTETFALLPGSAAIAAGNSSLLPSGVTADQRGEPRIVNSTMDIGAFESQGFTMTAASGSTPQAVLAGSAFTALGVTVKANNAVEPVAGGTVAFAVTPATDGASATLAASSAVIDSGGGATVAATANSTGGEYTVTASTTGVSSGVAFDLTNQVQPAFSGLSAPTMTYGTDSVKVSGTIAAGSQVPVNQSVSITLDGVNQSATIGSDGSFSTTFSGLGTLSVSGSPYTIAYAYTSDGTFLGASQSTSLTVNPATPTLSVTDAGGTYSGSTFAATDSVQGVSGPAGATLEGVGLTLTYYAGSTATGTPLSGAPSTAGTYTVAADFAGSTDYASSSAQTTFTIAQATPTVSVTDAGGTYDGSAFTASGTVQGASGPAGSTLEGAGLTFSYYAGSTATGTPLSGAPSSSGTYTVTADFAGSTDYTSGSSLATFTIAQATPTVNLSDVGGTYSGSAFVATDSVQGVSGAAGATLEGAGLTLTYYVGSTAIGTPLPGAPSTAGTYTVAVAFAGSTDYTSGSAQTTFTIAQATPTVSVTDAGGTYDGSAFGATDSVQGVSGPAGATLEGVGLTLNYYAGSTATGTPLSAAPSTAGTYTVVAAFAGSADYATNSKQATFTIAQASPTVSVSDGGGTYDGSAFAATDSVAGLSGVGASTLESVGLTLTYYTGNTATGTPLSGAPSTAGTYTVVADFTGSTDYAAGSQQATFTIAQATPPVSVTDAGGTYSSALFAASGTVQGVSGPAGATLENVGLTFTYYVGSTAAGTPLSGAPSTAGTYTVVADFAGSTDYSSGSAQTTFTITQASPTVNVNDAGGTYNGSALAGTGTVEGVSGPAGATLENVGLTFTYYAGSTATGTPLSGAPSTAGTYTVVADFAGSTDYTTGAAQSTFTIAQATPAVSVTDTGGAYSGSVFSASDSVQGVTGAAGATLEGVGLTLTYYVGNTATGTPLSGAPSTAGTYTVAADFAGSTDYTTGSAQATFTIAQATPTVSVTDAGGTYSGSAFVATGSVAGDSGVGSSTLEGTSLLLSYYAGGTATGTPLSGAPVSAGTYTVSASFIGSADYGAGSAQTTFTIAQASPTIVVRDAGGSYDGSSFAASATVAGLSGPGGASLEGVSLSLSYYAGTYASSSQLIGLTPLAGAPVHAGSYTVAANFGGSADYLAGSELAGFTIAQASSAAAWSSPSAIVYGQPLGVGQLDASAGVPGSFVYSPGVGAVLGVGSQTLSASFTPADSTDYAPASTSTTIQVEPATPTLSVTDAGGTYNGSPYAATATLLGVDGASGPALEGVAATFIYYAGSSTGGAPLPGAPSAAGTYTVVADFAGSTDYAAARSAPVTFAIAAGGVNVALASSSGSTPYGQPVTLSAAVTSAAGPAAPVTSGTVTFLDGSTPLGTAALDGSGQAELTVPSLGPGGHAITAVFDGSAGFQQGRSGQLLQSVAEDGTQIVLTPRPTLHGKKVVKLGLSAQVQGLPPGDGTPSGTLTFYFKKKVLGRAVLSGGQATLPIKLNKVLNKAITVVYSGDGDFQATTTTSPRMTKRSLASVALAAHPTIRRTPARFAFGPLSATARPHRA